VVAIVPPWIREPEIVDAAVGVGGVVLPPPAVGGGGVGFGATGPTGADETETEPYLFTALTTTWMFDPTSAVARTYVAPGGVWIVVQRPAVQRIQLYENEGVGLDQVPAAAVKVKPSTAVPEMVGRAVLFGKWRPGRA
jgi:hypothetical protein